MASRPMSPAEPTKKHPPPIQPNAHPYAIKTTSSALLSRSNSSPHSAHHARHHYIPAPPSRIPAMAGMRHRYTSSLPLVEGELRTTPGLLPIPPPVVGAPQDSASLPLNEPKPSHRVRRAETLPSGRPAEPTLEQPNHDTKANCDSQLEQYASLPPNPKEWNNDELVVYLETSLGSSNHLDGSTDSSGLADIVECVRTRGLTGRELLRLTDLDLAGTSLSDAHRAQLLERSRILRTDVLRGRIYVDEYRSHEVSDQSNAVHPHSVRAFHSTRGASMSADDLRVLLDDTVEGVFSTSPAMSLHRSDFVSDASAQRYRDLARMRVRRRGRVKGLIETWERASTSDSECSTSEESSLSGSEAESESEINQEFKSVSDIKGSPEPQSDLSSALLQDDDVHPSAADSTVVLQEPPASTPPPPYAHLHLKPEDTGDGEDEPSIEELLASSSDTPLKGGRAWEADFGLGETVKRAPIPIPMSADADSVSPSVTEQYLKNDGNRRDSVRVKGPVTGASARNTGKNTKTQRVVTAIFTGSLSDNAPENVIDSGQVAGVDNPTRHDASVPQNEPNDALRVLEDSIDEMRAQMVAFKLRLEKVEADTAQQEVELEQARCSSSSAESELRHRQLQAVEQTSTGQPGDGTLADASRSKGALEEWQTMSLRDVARAVVAKAIGWFFPYGHLGGSPCAGQDTSQARDSNPAVNKGCLSPTRRSTSLRMVRMSCSILLVSFAICAAVLRRVGLGRWIRRP